MEVVKNLKKHPILIIIVVLVIVGFGSNIERLFYEVSSDPLEPMSATGMTVEERSKHDSELIKKYITNQFSKVQEVEVNHERDFVRITTNIQAGEQHAEEVGEEIAKETEDIMSMYIDELTLEKEYSVYVYSNDGHILHMEINFN
jgi:hypothetical protein